MICVANFQVPIVSWMYDFRFSQVTILDFQLELRLHLKRLLRSHYESLLPLAESTILLQRRMKQQKSINNLPYTD